MATIAQLIDYLQQFDPKLIAVCHDDDFEGVGTYIELDWVLIQINIENSEHD